MSLRKRNACHLTSAMLCAGAFPVMTIPMVGRPSNIVIRKFLFSLATLLSFVSLHSCANDPISELNNEEFTVIAISDNITKTQIADEQTDDHLEISWLPSDSIGVFGAGTACYRFDNTLTVNSEHGVFKGTLPAGSQPLYAFYPYREGATDPTAVPIQIASQQEYSGPDSISENDIKASNNPVQDQYGTVFNFKSMASMLHITFVTGTYSSTVPNEFLRSITIEDAEHRSLSGDFIIDLQKLSLSPGKSTSSSVKVVTSTAPKLSDGIITAYAVVNSDIRKKDRMFITIETSVHKFTFSMNSIKDFIRGECYDIAIDLGKASSSSTFKAETIISLPKFSSFRFDAAKNQGAILDKEVYYDSSDKETKVKSSTGVSLQVDSDGNVSGCIPYLYDFNLIPTFTLSDNDPRFVVKVGNVAQQSGVSTQDFTNIVTYSICDTKTSCSVNYTVSVSNTGLPVIVLEQNTTGSHYFGSWNYYLDRYLVSKLSDFGTTDKIAIYKGKGEVSLEEMNCGFKQRGNFSMRFPKKSVNIKLSEKKKILGMSKSKKWCLISNWNDRTMLRNAVSFEIARRIAKTSSDDSGLDWQPSGRFVELVLNGMHVGTYFIVEQIKIDKNRVNVSDNYEDRRDDYASGKSTVAPTYANCGYLLELDNNSTDYASIYGPEDWYFRTDYCYERFASHVPVISHDAYDQTTDGSAIWNQLKAFVNSADKYIYNGDYSNAAKYVDMTSAADYMLVMEMTMNHEYMHPKSVYLHKDGEGKLFFGPVWDFDVWTYPSIPNISDMGRQYESYPNSYSKWTFSTESSSHYYFWYRHLLKEDDFVNLVKNRWNAISSDYSLSPDSIDSYIESLAEEIATSMEFNDRMWPHTYTSPCSGYQNGDEWSSDSAHTTYTFKESVDLLKHAYRTRYEKMGTMVSGL